MSETLQTILTLPPFCLVDFTSAEKITSTINNQGTVVLLWMSVMALHF